MPINEQWSLFMDWMKLGSRGIIEPLRCPNDDKILVGSSVNGEPALWCYWCNCNVDLGLIFWDRIQTIVEEHR